jgi:peptidoglycan/xylan/chitin deacetylase (PgdA/CDA1 family)
LVYFVKTPFWLKKLYPNCIWGINNEQRNIYLTFDDGPHPTITPIVLEHLKKYQAKATFFCIGQNVEKFPEIYKQIIEEGHAVGNHTHHHLNGWKTDDEKYLADIVEAKQLIDSDLFRPPYGRITRFQLAQLRKIKYQLSVIMWTVLSGDFDYNITKEKCLQNVLKNTKPGSIVVFHDSEKAKEKVLYALPKMLTYFTQKGFGFKKIALT